jgi:formylglycine-generating enzyme
MRLTTSAQLVAAATVAACSVLVDLDVPVGVGPPDAAPTVEGGAPGDAAVVEPTDAGLDRVAPCALARAGPALVDGGAFCIDATEVTQAQYAEFLAAEVPLTDQPPECAWNQSFVPASSWSPVERPERAVGAVDWCDARAYCAWAGKRLCGKIGGGSSAVDAPVAHLTEQWPAACANFEEGRLWAYGSEWDASICNMGGSRVEVGTFPGCEGGLPGLFDMTGNVAEWTDECEEPDAGTDAAAVRCAMRGGSYRSSPNNARCNSASMRPRHGAEPWMGFRCCAD